MLLCTRYMIINIFSSSSSSYIGQRSPDHLLNVKPTANDVNEDHHLFIVMLSAYCHMIKENTVCCL